jgi:iron(III) transport system permease protein
VIRVLRAVVAEPVRYAIFAAVTVVLVGVLAYPLGLLIVRSFRAPGVIGPTLANYVELVTHPDLLASLRHSFVVAIWTTLAALALAIPMAWGVARTNMPGKGWVRSLTVLTFASPSFLGAIAWMILLGPRGGKLNLFLRDLFRLDAPPFNIFSPGGIVFVLALFSYPVVFFIVSAAMENLDASLEECARVLGGGRWHVTRTVSMPLVLPAVLAGAILVFVEALVIFGPPAVLGVPVGYHTLATRMFTMFDYPPRFEMAAVLAVPIIATLAVLLLIQRLWLHRRRYEVLTGKGARPQQYDLGPWRWLLAGYSFGVIGLSVGLPFVTLLYAASLRAFGMPLTWDNFALAQNVAFLFRQPTVVRALWHSLVLAAGGTFTALALSLAMAWLIERTTVRGKGLLSLAMLASFAFPGVALGIGLVLAYSRAPWNLYGTLWLFFFAYTARGLPVGFVFCRSALKQLSRELEEATRVFGASWLRSLRDVVVPLLRSALLGAGVLLFVVLFREISASVFLHTAGNEVTAVVIYEFYNEVQFTLMTALSVIVAVANVAVVLVARRAVGRNPMTLG